MATKHDFHKVVIGRAEVLSFVDLEMPNVPAKTDTGAYRSAVHATDITVEDGVLSFTLLGGHPLCGALAQRVSVTDFKQVKVENSFGHAEERYEVKLRVKLGPKVFSAQFTLANRAQKVYPILLGRKMLNNRFLVDSSVSAVNRAALKKQYSIDLPLDLDEGREELESELFSND